MDTLRWILLLVGIAIIALVYFTGRRPRRDVVDEISSAEPVGPLAHTEPRIDVKRRAPEPKDVDQELAQLGTLIAENRRTGSDAIAKSPLLNPSARVEKPAASVRAQQETPEPTSEKIPEKPPQLQDKIIVLYVMAPPGGRFSGVDVRRAIEMAGLQFGQMNIFHRLVDPSQPDSDAVFSVANSVEPGSFDLAALDNFTTPGLTMFMQLPGPLNGITALDSMLAAAHIIATELHGELRDQSRSVLSKQSIEFLHGEIVEYQRLQRLARAAS